MAKLGAIRSSWLAALAATALVLAGGHAAPALAESPYDLVDLGKLPNADSSFAQALNNQGEVVGFSGSPAFSHAFLWRNGAMFDLGTLGGPHSYANDINDAGEIVGRAETASQMFHAVRWKVSSTGQVTTLDLGTLGGGAADHSQAAAINDLGQIVGWSSVANTPDFVRAFLWSAGAMSELPGASSSSHPTGAAYDINHAGHILLREDYIGTFLRRGSDLVPVQGLDGSQSMFFLEYLNDADQVASTSYVPGCIDWRGNPCRHAYLWEKGQVIDLGSLSIRGYSVATGINNHGQVVGHAEIDPDPLHTNLTAAHLFLYNGGVMVDLAPLMPSNFPIGPVSATAALNDSGQIASTGTFGSEHRAFLLTPRANLASLTVSPALVVGGTSALGRVTLDGPAPPGAIVHIESTNEAASVPQSVPIAMGQTSATFEIGTAAVKSVKTGTITATYRGVTRTAPLTVRPIGVQSLALMPSSVRGGSRISRDASSIGTVTLEAPAGPGPITVNLSTFDARTATVTSGTISIPPGATTGSFGVATRAVAAKTLVTVRALANQVGEARILTVTP